jgi:hypothetical protein
MDGMGFRNEPPLFHIFDSKSSHFFPVSNRVDSKNRSICTHRTVFGMDDPCFPSVHSTLQAVKSSSAKDVLNATVFCTDNENFGQITTVIHLNIDDNSFQPISAQDYTPANMNLV